MFLHLLDEVCSCSQIVFRSDPGKFKKLKYECDEFRNLVTTSFGLAKNIGSMSTQEIIGQVHNWQV